MDFPVGTVVKTPCFHCRRHASQGPKTGKKDAAVNNLAPKLLHMYKFLEAELLDQNLGALVILIDGQSFFLLICFSISISTS